MRSHNQKATLAELTNSYNDLQSVWKVADKFSMCGQTVHARLQKAGVKFQNQKITEEERGRIKEVYEKGFKRGDSALKDLSNEIGRTVPLISRTAKQMGLTNICRGLTNELLTNISKNSKEWHSKNEHPKGMKGKTHSDDYKKECSIRLKNWWANATQEEKNENRKQAITTKRADGKDNNHRGSWKAAWRTIGGKRKFFRSRWEANYARYLEFLKINNHIKDWFHEPETFWFEKIKRGCRSYLPDFKIINLDDSHEWHEVKGWMDDRSKTKLKRFARYYPKEKITVIDKKWFSKNAKKMKIICKDWEIK